MCVINGEYWRVVIVPPNHQSLLMPNEVFALGACDDEFKVICISDALHDEMFEQVLCHELVHACMFAYNIRLEHYEEELVAEIISVFGEEIIDISDAVFNRIAKGRYK